MGAGPILGSPLFLRSPVYSKRLDSEGRAEREGEGETLSDRKPGRKGLTESILKGASEKDGIAMNYSCWGIDY